MTGRWEEAIKVQGQLFALAEELPEKLSVARNAAHLVEHEVKDLVRAFRAYLNAFRLAPDDEEIVGAPLAAGGASSAATTAPTSSAVQPSESETAEDEAIEAPNGRQRERRRQRWRPTGRRESDGAGADAEDGDGERRPTSAD